MKLFNRRSNPSPEIPESHRALQEAYGHVDEVRSHMHEVQEVVEALREARRKNHFAEQIALIMGK